MFCLCSDMIVRESCFCPAPSRSQSGLVWCWCSVKLFLPDRRTPRPSWWCQASSWVSGGYLLFFSAAHCVTPRRKQYVSAACAVITGLRQHLPDLLPKSSCVFLWDLKEPVRWHFATIQITTNYFCTVVVLKHARKFFSQQVAGVYSPSLESGPTTVPCL